MCIRDSITIARNTTDDAPARQFADYTVTVDNSDLPEGITIDRKI